MGGICPLNLLLPSTSTQYFQLPTSKTEPHQPSQSRRQRLFASQKPVERREKKRERERETDNETKRGSSVAGIMSSLFLLSFVCTFKNNYSQFSTLNQHVRHRLCLKAVEQYKQVCECQLIKLQQALNFSVLTQDFAVQSKLFEHHRSITNMVRYLDFILTTASQDRLEAFITSTLFKDLVTQFHNICKRTKRLLDRVNIPNVSDESYIQAFVDMHFRTLTIHFPRQ